MYQAFLERAEIEVDFVRSEDGRLKAEQETLERRLSKIKHRRQLISDVDARLRSYAPSSEHCPVCHIRGDSTDSPLAVSLISSRVVILASQSKSSSSQS